MGGSAHSRLGGRSPLTASAGTLLMAPAWETAPAHHCEVHPCEMASRARCATPVRVHRTDVRWHRRAGSISPPVPPLTRRGAGEAARSRGSRRHPGSRGARATRVARENSCRRLGVGSRPRAAAPCHGIDLRQHGPPSARLRRAQVRRARSPSLARQRPQVLQTSRRIAPSPARSIPPPRPRSFCSIQSLSPVARRKQTLHALCQGDAITRRGRGLRVTAGTTP